MKLLPIGVCILSTCMAALPAAGQSSSLPTPWIAQDIGNPKPAGTTTFSAGTFTVSAGGNDIYGAADQFRFVEQPVNGDVDIRARVDSLVQTDDYAKAGVMIRSGLTANASNAFAALSMGDGLAFQRRKTTGGSTAVSWGDNYDVPQWVRLVRSGTTVTAYSSADGSTWKKIGNSVTLSLGTTAYVGIAVTSHNPAALTTAKVSQVSVSGSAGTPPPPTAPKTPTGPTGPTAPTTPTAPAPANQPPVVTLMSPAGGSTSTAPATISLAASASDPENRMARVDFYNGSALIGSDTASPYSFNWSSVPAGSYSFHATAVDQDGGTATSASATVTVSAAIVVPPPTSPTPAPPTSTSITPGTGALYISPTGNDRNTGSLTSPLKTFAAAFLLLKPGGELVLLDGTYGEAEGTGAMNYNGGNSAQIPSGTASSPTYVHALNPGAVKVNGQLFIGRSNRKDSYIVVDGISFEGGSTASAAAIYNSSFVTIRNGGFHSTVNDGGGVFDVGTNDGSWGNTNDVFEDLWIWGKARAIFDNYRADGNTWRRIVVRGDGCSSSDCAGSGNPNIGTTVYDSAHVTFENVIVMDRLLVGSGNGYADFAVAQHTPGIPGGDNMWLGAVSLNAPDVGFYMEPDQQTINPSNTLVNVVTWNSAEDGISIARSGQAIVQNATLKPRTGSALYFGSGLVSGSKATTVLALSGGVSGVTVSGLSTSDPAMLYPVRSALGATVEFRYQDRQLTTTPLWPWPNEDRIKAEMCAGTTRGFCADSSLTHYVWNQLGHGSPY